MITQSEKSPHFRHREVIDGRVVEIVARHTVRNRLPRPAEYARALNRGRGPSMVLEEEYSWLVLINGRHVAVLTEARSGAPACRGRVFPRMSVTEAGLNLAQSILPSRQPGGPSTAPAD